MNLETETLLSEQRLALNEFKSSQKINSLPFNPKATRFVLSDSRLIELKDLKTPYKQTFFKALSFMNYSIQNPDNIEFGNVRFFTTVTVALVVFLNTVTLNKNDKAKALKKFESFRVDNGCRPQSSGLKEIRTLLLKCLVNKEFTDILNHVELQYLETLSKTKVAPNVDVHSCTLTEWFTQHTWLRRDDIGIGSALYERLSSPRALNKSFEITVGVSLLTIQKLKNSLILFFQSNLGVLKGFPSKEIVRDGSLTVDQIKNDKRIQVAAMIKFIRTAYYQTDNKSEELEAAIICILHSVTIPSKFKLMTDTYFANEEDVKSYLTTQKKIPSHLFSMDHSELFSLTFLNELFIHSKNTKTGICPTTDIEKKLFQWIMSSLKVQTSDIPKLTLRDFKFLKRVNGNITHIESEYFKGRAKDYHVTSSVPTNTPTGEALLNFILDRTTNSSNTKLPLSEISHCRAFSVKGKNGKLVSLLQIPYINNLINEEHVKKKSVSLFLPALEKLFSNGLLVTLKEAKDTESPVMAMFSFTAIKNTAVHAASDKFDPTQLLNHNSHNNETERNSYLTEDNEEWKNNCGRITRAVMNDIEVNLYRSTQLEKQSFKSEFIKVIDFIKIKKAESLARFKIITDREDGSINDLGISRKPHSAEVDLPDAIYLVDSPETVMKLKHYLFEAEKHHKALLRQAPEFTFNTLLPTVEWIEVLFQKSKFSLSSLTKGMEMFNAYKKVLPSLFTAQGV
jgi:hypothetical protein